MTSSASGSAGSKWTLGLILVLVLAFSLLNRSGADGRGPEEPWPRRVLITNDDGIDDPRIQALARAFAATAETWVVAPSRDRSGSSNFSTFGTEGRPVKATPKELGHGIRAWALDAYPSDCVYFALRGPMLDSPPDLVISGVNGGSNVGPDWFYSGTVGAARTAAFAGIPALAVSGLRDDDPEAMRAVTSWIVRLASTPTVRDLEAGDYLAVSFPRALPREIRGVEITSHARLKLAGFPRFEPGKSSEDGSAVWTPVDTGAKNHEHAEDIRAVDRNYIAVVPMHVHEFDSDLARQLRRKSRLLPAWEPVELPGPGPR